MIGETGTLELEVWHCHPEISREEAVSRLRTEGCGYVMLQAADCTRPVTACPSCGEEFAFRPTEYTALLDVAPKE